MTFQDIIARERMLNRHELQQLVGYSHMHILRLEKDGRFPRRIQIGENRVGWRLGDILDWIESRRRITPIAHQEKQDSEA